MTLHHVGLTVPYFALLLAPIAADSPFKSVAVLAFAKCFPIAVLAKDTYPKNQTIAIGLGLSMIGDLFLALSHKHYFIHGLGSFLVAHITYIKAIQQTQPPFAPLSLLGLGSFGALVTSTILLPHVPRALKIPVVFYAATLVGMAWRSVARFTQTREAAATAKKTNSIAPNSDYTCAKWGLAGAILFVASDFLLGYNKFVEPLPQGQVWIMITYYAAQIAIAKSA
ncbi:UNVERIFIED_CONTAM: hypothetical protein HDU68_011111 [Siphonaria sp. JEL0065]|nr:hypothetical protein HDU68_011111 [Siphonaria sp. JEL0065]